MQNHFHIVASGRNCWAYIEPMIASIANQTYQNFHATIIDDDSYDGSFIQLQRVVSRLPVGIQQKIRMIPNTRQLGTVRNKEIAIVEFSGPDDVIVWLDTDDELMTHALEYLNANHLYQRPDVWMTYGNYVTTSGEIPFNMELLTIPDSVHADRSYRLQSTFYFMHLRTFRKRLFDALRKIDIYPRDWNGLAYADASMLYCMMELSGRDHMVAIDEVLYRYNNDNPRSVMRMFNAESRQNELNGLKKIKPLQSLIEL